MKRECYVALGFDGTCVTHNYPNVGEDVGADLWLKAALGMKAKLILYTVRDHDKLVEAVEWFDNHGIELWAINKNLTQGAWSESPKIHRHITVDDSSLGIPLKRHGNRGRWVVDWDIAGPKLLRDIAGKLNQ
jgi:hypothetical protein